MPSQKNLTAVETLREQLSQANLIIATGFRGLSVDTLNQLRKKLRENGIAYKVVKNRLVSIAAREIGKPEIAQLLEGPTALLLGQGDPVQVTKTLDEHLRATRIPLTVRGGLLDNRVLSSQEVTALATLPPKSVLVAQLAGQLIAQISGMLSLLNAPAQRLAYVLGAPSQGMATVLQRHVEREGAG